MKNRDLFLVGAAAGAVVGGLTWLFVRHATEVGQVEPLRVGEPFPTISGTTLNGNPMTIPDDVLGRVNLLVLGFDYDARFEVDEWAKEILGEYGERPDFDVYVVPMISGVGAVMRQVIDTAMVRGTSPEEQAHVLTVYGDLRWLQKKLEVDNPRQAQVFLLGRTGRVTWRAAGPVAGQMCLGLEEALVNQGIAKVGG
ncbi:MAG: hypothetical protein ACYDBB_04345 [Armatimonadota bacterium]